MKLLQVGQLAKLAGVSSDTLRFYEKEGLLLPITRSDSGYRLYDQSAIGRIGFILKAKRLGLTLDEIHELLDIRLEANKHSCAEVKHITQGKLDELDNKIQELQEIRAALKTINDACCGHQEDNASHCSILEALDAHRELKR